MITQNQLKQVLNYNKDTGDFIWVKSSKHRPHLLNKKAGYVNKNGYIKIKINQKHYFAHRLAFLYVHGYFPEITDHINGKKNDNRICNLREATPTQNTQNHNRDGGVRKLPYGRFQARISNNKKQINLGVFDNYELAKNAYLQARKNIHDCPASMIGGIK